MDEDIRIATGRRGTKRQMIRCTGSHRPNLACRRFRRLSLEIDPGDDNLARQHPDKGGLIKAHLHPPFSIRLANRGKRAPSDTIQQRQIDKDIHLPPKKIRTMLDNVHSEPPQRRPALIAYELSRFNLSVNFVSMKKVGSNNFVLLRKTQNQKSPFWSWLDVESLKIAWMHSRSKHWHFIDYVLVFRTGVHD
ncbi:hypothetical protein LOAG_09026, partial [Loa loa]